MSYLILVISLLLSVVGSAQEVISYTDSSTPYPTTNYRLLKDSVYINKTYPDPNSKVDQSASYNYDNEAVVYINKVIKDALGDVRYSEIDGDTGGPKILILTLYIDSTNTIKESSYRIKHTELKEEDIAKIAIALKGKRFEVPPFYSEFSYVKLDVSFPLLNTEYL